MLRLTRSGSSVSLAELTADDYRQLETRLKNYVRKRVSNDDEVDDLVQDIFVKAARTWQGCEAPLNLVAWLFTAARTTIIDHYRKKTAAYLGGGSGSATIARHRRRFMG
jgi:RNA polymerase sigma factor (sigma-70 family)